MTVATTFLTPPQWGSRGAQRPLTAYTAADVLGLGLHWEGSGAPPDDHDDCAQRVRDDEAYHLDVAEPPNHYAALAYSAMYCNHGTVFIGPRALEYRTGANGDATVNATYLAACWIGGPGHAPTPAAKRAARDFRGLMLMRYPGALSVKPHRWLVSGGTECPGPDLIAYAAELDGTPDDGPGPIPVPTHPKEEHVAFADFRKNSPTKWTCAEAFHPAGAEFVGVSILGAKASGATLTIRRNDGSAGHYSRTLNTDLAADVNLADAADDMRPGLAEGEWGDLFFDTIEDNAAYDVKYVERRA